MNSGNRTASYHILPDAGGAVRVQFFCELSDALICVTAPIRAETPEQALAIAWETEGKTKFNTCKKCGRFVSDVMYNADVHECVACAPWENYPLYCHRCGKRIVEIVRHCPQCGVLLRYEGS